MKENNFYSLFRRRHLFNGKICLQHFVLCVLYIKCKIILSKNKAPFNKVRFSLRTMYHPQGKAMSVKGLWLSSIPCLPLLHAHRVQGGSPMLPPLYPCFGWQRLLVSAACCLYVRASGKGSPVFKCWVTSHNLFLSNWPGKYTLRFQGGRNTKYFLIKLGIICLAGITAVQYFSIVSNQTLSSALLAHSNNNDTVFNV